MNFRIIFKRPDLQKMSIEQRMKKHQQGWRSEISPESSEKSSVKILALMQKNAEISAKEIADELGISSRVVEKQIAKLREGNRIKRIGSDRGGYWEVVKK